MCVRKREPLKCSALRIATLTIDVHAEPVSEHLLRNCVGSENYCLLARKVMFRTKSCKICQVHVRGTRVGLTLWHKLQVPRKPFPERATKLPSTLRFDPGDCQATPRQAIASSLGFLPLVYNARATARETLDSLAMLPSRVTCFRC